MSQVKNLRAMFETKGDDTSPPDRGRSPGGAVTPSADSPRPLSKIRSSFVAIEKDGVIGLRRDPSFEPSPSRRPPSADMDAASVSTTATADDTFKTPRKLFVNDPIPESPRSPAAAAANDVFQSGPSAVTDKSSIEKTADQKASTSSSAPMDQAEKPVPTESGISTPSRAKSPAKSSAPSPKKVDARKEQPKDKPAATKPGAGKQPATSTTSAAANKAVSTKPAAKAQPKATTSTKPAATTARQPATKTAARTTERTTVRKPASTAAASSTTKQNGQQTKPPPIKTGQVSDTGFIKPKPKSPTKPVKLPSSLTAPTASSVSKGGSSRLQPPATANRAPSRTGAITPGGTKAVRRQAPAATQGRPSIGLPPKKAGQESAGGRRDSHVDEGFLARMMRPTQSSSSKVQEKVPITPPKKPSQRSSLGTATSRRGSSVKSQTGLSSAHSVASTAGDDVGQETNKSEIADSEMVAEPSVTSAPEPSKPLVEEREPAEPVKVEETPQPEPAAESEIKQEPEVEIKEPEPEIKQEPELEVKQEPEPEIKQESEPEIKQKPKSEVKQELEPEVEQALEPEVKQEPEPETQQEPEIKQEAEPEVKQEPESEVQQEPELEVKQESGPEVKQEPEAEPEPKIETKQENEPEVNIKEENLIQLDLKAETETKIETTEENEGQKPQEVSEEAEKADATDELAKSLEQISLKEDTTS